jgi:hypothetical protein
MPTQATQNQQTVEVRIRQLPLTVHSILKQASARQQVTLEALLIKVLSNAAITLKPTLG